MVLFLYQNYNDDNFLFVFKHGIYTPVTIVKKQEERVNIYFTTINIKLVQQ